MNYKKTLIAIAADCTITKAVVPEERGGKPTVATLQYAMLAKNPYTYTQEDVLFEVWWKRQEESGQPKATARTEFFKKDQPCLRTSPLAKNYGYGLLFDEGGRVALCPMESKEYREMVKGKKVVVLKAMASKRKR